MSTPPVPEWLSQLIAEEGESKPMDVQEREVLIRALEAATAPQALPSERHQRVLADVLQSTDPFAPPDDDELAESARLRDHLDSDPLVVSLRSAQVAHLPPPQFELRIREEALRRAAPPRHRRGLSRAATLWGTLAVAAAAALVVLSQQRGASEDFQASLPQKPLALSRSTDSLFVRPFDSSSPSERIDKIAQVRARDLRQNRYAIWGLP